MKVYYLNKMGDMRLAMFNGADDFLVKYEMEELGELVRGKNFTVIDSFIQAANLVSLDDVKEVMVSVGKVDNDEVKASLLPVKNFKGFEQWEPKLREALAEYEVADVAKVVDVDRVLANAFALITDHEVVGSIARSTAKLVVAEAIHELSVDANE